MYSTLYMYDTSTLIISKHWEIRVFTEYTFHNKDYKMNLVTVMTVSKVFS